MVPKRQHGLSSSWKHILLQLLLLLLLIALAQGQNSTVLSPNAMRSDSGLNLESSASTTEGPNPTPLQQDNKFLGIPGTTQTTNGYDTALGSDAICWVGFTNSTNATSSSTSASSSQAIDLVKQVFPNPLVSDFAFLETRILSDCPSNNTVTIEKPPEALRGERLRTMRSYDYTLHVDIDLDALDGDQLFTDDRNDTIALQVVVCSLGKSGFCSPFVHEQGTVT